MDQQRTAFGQCNAADDEIDLFELLTQFYKGKFIILAVVLACLVMAAVAVWQITPVYKSSVQFLPPAEIDLLGMNKLHLLDAKSQKFDTDKVLQMFSENLTSEELKKHLFEQFHLETLFIPQLHDLPEIERSAALRHALAKFSASFSLSQPGKNATTQDRTISLSLRGSPEQTALILNQFYEQARQKTVADIHAGIMLEQAARIRQTDDQIKVLRKSAMSRRQDRIVQLDEAISIARALNLEKPREVWPDMAVQGVHNQGLPLYSLGFLFLEAEKNVLAQRKGDDPFIAELRNLQEQVSTLEELNIDLKAFQPARLRLAAAPADKPEKPKPLLIFALASVAGLMLGVVIVLVRQAIINRRQSQTT
ncbi:MAG: LPS O-antigen chain length determinant protein WzzB [Gammaproteobacteria bacterium]|nr:LPS O-antigen chain length determinant protein WzzB [Gammaproteobacteria bacterium]